MFVQYYCLSGNPKLTPNSGYTNLVNPLTTCICSRVCMSLASILTSFRFSSMRDGVTDFASTELPRATWANRQQWNFTDYWTHKEENVRRDCTEIA